MLVTLTGLKHDIFSLLLSDSEKNKGCVSFCTVHVNFWFQLYIMVFRGTYQLKGK